MSWIDDIIESLPSEYEQLARTYLPTIQRMAKEEVLTYMDYLRIDDEVKAHAILVQKMTTEEIVADGNQGNELIKELNKGNAEQVKLGWHVLRMIVTIGLDRL